MPRTRKQNGIFDWAKTKETRYDAAAARRAGAAHGREIKAERARKKKAAAEEEREKRAQLRRDALEVKRDEMAERKRKIVQKRTDAADRKIEAEWREKGTRNPPTKPLVYKGIKITPVPPTYDRYDVDLPSGTIRLSSLRDAKDWITREKGTRNPVMGYGVYVRGIMGEEQLEHFTSRLAAEAWARSNNIEGYKIKRAFTKSNPMEPAADLAESWHGRPAQTATDVTEQVRYHSVLTDLGELQEIKVLVTARKAQAITFDDDTRLCSSENGKQLYVVGGDQSLDLEALGIKGEEAEKDSVVVGEVYSLTYITAKHHLGRADKVVGPYEHAFRDEGGNAPMLVYDTLNESVSFAGGAYRIDPTDYDGRHSAGIRG